MLWLWLKFIVKKCQKFFNSAILIWKTRFRRSGQSRIIFFVSLLDCLILWNSEFFVTNVPTKVYLFLLNEKKNTCTSRYQIRFGSIDRALVGWSAFIRLISCYYVLFDPRTKALLSKYIQYTYGKRTQESKRARGCGPLSQVYGSLQLAYKFSHQFHNFEWKTNW